MSWREMRTVLGHLINPSYADTRHWETTDVRQCWYYDDMIMIIPDGNKAQLSMRDSDIGWGLSELPVCTRAKPQNEKLSERQITLNPTGSIHKKAKKKSKQDPQHPLHSNHTHNTFHQWEIQTRIKCWSAVAPLRAEQERISVTLWGSLLRSLLHSLWLSGRGWAKQETRNRFITRTSWLSSRCFFSFTFSWSSNRMWLYQEELPSFQDILFYLKYVNGKQ